MCRLQGTILSAAPWELRNWKVFLDTLSPAIQQSAQSEFNAIIIPCMNMVPFVF